MKELSDSDIQKAAFRRALVRWARPLQSVPRRKTRRSPMRNETYTCDVCGRSKQETNQWFRLEFGSDLFVLMAWSQEAKSRVHLCGQECASKKLSEWMKGQTP